MSWYVASLLILRPDARGVNDAALRCQYLVEAGSHDEAYDRALELGRRVSEAAGRFLGVADLLLVPEPPDDGAELLWSESEMTDAEIAGCTIPKSDTRALRGPLTGSGWYVGRIILREVHDEGSHGPLSLVWKNTYLIRASDPSEAYSRAVSIGTGQQDEPGSHRCDGESAHWEFRGVHDVIPARDAPAPGALLWCEHAGAAADHPVASIPEKADLTVFRWEAERSRRGG